MSFSTSRIDDESNLYCRDILAIRQNCKPHQNSGVSRHANAGETYANSEIASTSPSIASEATAVTLNGTLTETQPSGANT